MIDINPKSFQLRCNNDSITTNAQRIKSISNYLDNMYKGMSGFDPAVSTTTTTHVCTCKEKQPSYPKPKYILEQKENNATIVYWEDGTRTVVRLMEGEKPDIYAAFCSAFAKKVFGGTASVHKMVDEANAENIRRKKEEDKTKRMAEQKKREDANRERREEQFNDVLMRHLMASLFKGLK